MVMRVKPKRPPPSQDDVSIRVRGLYNSMGGNVIHDHIDLDVKRGEVLAVVGGSGSGKSVLLRSIIGLHTPTEGEIRVLGGERVSDVGPQHIEGPVRDIDDAGDAEDQRQADGDEE